MNTYEISYTSFDDRDAHPRGERIVVGEMRAKNGIEAIKTLLAARFGDDADLKQALDTARSLGSNKRVVVAGITFTARKLS